MTVLGALATATSEARIGGHVLCNLFCHPSITALATSTLDHLSNGRAVLGIGAGWTRNEFEMMGLSYPDIQPRLRMLDEALTIVKSLWTEPRTTFSGEFYRLENAISVPKPVQEPHPPIVLGGSGKGLLRIAARHADVVNVIVDIGRAGTVLTSEIAKLTEESFQAKLDFVRREARACGRDPILSTTLFLLIITDSPEATVQTAGAVAAGFGLDPQHALHIPIGLIGHRTSASPSSSDASVSGASAT
jgi:alkanesulfonate monooxygenase SsuD/methylene tetrahydromethanopterin reductase-like flavin-dependent oxidoreductase (luciferase family)